MTEWHQSPCFNCSVNCCAGEPIHILRQDWERVAQYQLQSPTLFTTKDHCLILNSCPFQESNHACHIQQLKPYICYRFPFVTAINGSTLEFLISTECPKWNLFTTFEHFYQAVVAEFYMMGFTAEKLITNPACRLELLNDFTKLTLEMERLTANKPSLKQLPICYFRNSSDITNLARKIYRSKIHPSKIPEPIQNEILSLYKQSLNQSVYPLR